MSQIPWYLQLFLYESWLAWCCNHADHRVSFKNLIVHLKLLLIFLAVGLLVVVVLLRFAVARV